MRAVIMEAVPSALVDVRQMLCAQALAVVAQAMGRIEMGEIVQVLYDTEDVRRDLLAWASDRGHRVDDRRAAMLHIERGR